MTEICVRCEYKVEITLLKLVIKRHYCTISASLSSVSTHGTAFSPGSSVGLSVGLSVRKVYCAKMAEQIRMPFGVVSGVGLGIRVLHGGRRASREELISGVYHPHSPIVLNAMKSLQYFCTHNISLKSAFHWLSKDAV